MKSNLHVLVLSLSLSACASGGTMIEERSIYLTSTYKLDRSVELGKRYGVGIFSQVSDSDRNEILDMKDSLNIASFPAFYKKSEVRDQRAIIVGSVDAVFGNQYCAESTARFACRKFTKKYALTVRIDRSVRTDITNPLEFLETINRPLTGAIYNRTAEQRIQTWRSTLTSAILNLRSKPDTDIKLTTSVEKVTRSFIEITSKIPREAAEKLASEVSNEMGLGLVHIKQKAQSVSEDGQFLFAIGRPFIVGATEQSVQINDTQTGPFVHFAFGPSRTTSIWNQ